MVLLTPQQFISELRVLMDLYQSTGLGPVKVNLKQIPSAKVTKKTVESALQSDERCCLIRAYRWHQSKKIKISVVVSTKEHQLYQSKISQMLQDMIKSHCFKNKRKHKTTTE